MQAKNIDLNDTEEFYLETNSLLHRKKKRQFTPDLHHLAPSSQSKFPKVHSY